MRRSLAILAAISALASAGAAQAAAYRFDAPAEVGIGTPFQIDVVLDAEGEQVNAFEGAVRYPADLFEALEIRDGSSIVTLWLDRPGIPTSCGGSCAISFSGITPGGVDMSRGLLFSVVLRAKGPGTGAFSFSGTRVLRNDGRGTPATLAAEPAAVRARAGAPTEAPETIADTAPPEPFTAFVTRDPSLFDGRYFVAFVTHDKQSGIASYEVQESRSREPDPVGWKKATSPHELADQSRRSFIFVRATDKAGNERISVSPPMRLPFYKNAAFWSILVLVAAIALGYALRPMIYLWRRNRRRNRAR